MDFLSNKYLLAAFFASLAILFTALFFPPFETLLSLVPLSWNEMGLIVVVGLANLAVIEISKHFIFR
jgi:hypothetical protein